MKQSFYVYNNGDLKRKDNTLQFTNYDGEKRDIPIERISDIYVMSEMSFNTKFINYISQYGIPMHFFNYYSFYTGSYYPRESLLAGQLLVKQVSYYTDYEKRLVLARKFIEDSRTEARKLVPESKDDFRDIVYSYMSRTRRADVSLLFR